MIPQILKVIKDKYFIIFFLLGAVVQYIVLQSTQHILFRSVAGGLKKIFLNGNNSMVVEIFLYDFLFTPFAWILFCLVFGVIGYFIGQTIRKTIRDVHTFGWKSVFLYNSNFYIFFLVLLIALSFKLNFKIKFFVYDFLILVLILTIDKKTFKNQTFRFLKFFFFYLLTSVALVSFSFLFFYISIIDNSNVSGLAAGAMAKIQFIFLIIVLIVHLIFSLFVNLINKNKKQSYQNTREELGVKHKIALVCGISGVVLKLLFFFFSPSLFSIYFIRYIVWLLFILAILLEGLVLIKSQTKPVRSMIFLIIFISLLAFFKISLL